MLNLPTFALRTFTAPDVIERHDATIAIRTRASDAEGTCVHERFCVTVQAG
jgi:hypothetical protein